MRFVTPSYEILSELDGEKICRFLEKIARVCYKSEDKITEESYKDFLRNIIKRGHESVIEHANMTVRFICDRGVSHELVRHRIASFSQESTRYCDYSNDKFGRGVAFIRPPAGWLLQEQVTSEQLQEALGEAERMYNESLKAGWSPQQARGFLPNFLKTDIVVTANMREWRHIFRLRTSKAAHPQMRELMIPLFGEVRSKVPVLFDDIKVDY